MNILWGLLIVAAVSAVAVTSPLVVRRTAPEGGYFNDSDRAAGGFGVLATGFSVLLGFLIFLGFESYDASRSGAEAEALIVAQQVQTAQLLPSEVSADLTGELVCYARYVVTASGRKWRTARSARPQPVGRVDVPDAPGRRTELAERRGGVRAVAGTDDHASRPARGGSTAPTGLMPPRCGSRCSSSRS